jgi:hypothetical protein
VQPAEKAVLIVVEPRAQPHAPVGDGKKPPSVLFDQKAGEAAEVLAWRGELQPAAPGEPAEARLRPVLDVEPPADARDLQGLGRRATMARREAQREAKREEGGS